MFLERRQMRFLGSLRVWLGNYSSGLRMADSGESGRLCRYSSSVSSSSSMVPCMAQSRRSVSSSRRSMSVRVGSSS